MSAAYIPLVQHFPASQVAGPGTSHPRPRPPPLLGLVLAKCPGSRLCRSKGWVMLGCITPLHFPDCPCSRLCPQDLPKPMNFMYFADFCEFFQIWFLQDTFVE